MALLMVGLIQTYMFEPVTDSEEVEKRNIQAYLQVGISEW